MKANHKQLILARQYQGVTQSELSNSIDGLSQSTLSKFEKGIGVIPDDIFNEIAIFLGFPLSFFEKDVSIRIMNTHYRKRSNVSVKEIQNIEATITLISDLIDSMSQDLDFPTFVLSEYNIDDGYPIEKIADFIRIKLNLKYDKPVKNIISVIEKAGIVVIEIETQLNNFDGVSLKTNMGIPIIIINKDMSNDRKRFTLAHELGHIVLHLSEDYIINEHRDKEKEANTFAANFLMPHLVIKDSLYDLRLSYLADLKRYWLTSMASITHRAKSIGCLTQDKYTYLNIELSRRGYKKKEPFDVYIDSPKLAKTAYNIYKNDLNYSDEEISRSFSLPMKLVKDLFNPVEEKKRIKLTF